MERKDRWYADMAKFTRMVYKWVKLKMAEQDDLKWPFRSKILLYHNNLKVILHRGQGIQNSFFGEILVCMLEEDIRETWGFLTDWSIYCSLILIINLTLINLSIRDQVGSSVFGNKVFRLFSLDSSWKLLCLARCTCL